MDEALRRSIDGLGANRREVGDYGDRPVERGLGQGWERARRGKMDTYRVFSHYRDLPLSAPTSSWGPSASSSSVSSISNSPPFRPTAAHSRRLSASPQFTFLPRSSSKLPLGAKIVVVFSSLVWFQVVDNAVVYLAKSQSLQCYFIGLI